MMLNQKGIVWMPIMILSAIILLTGTVAVEEKLITINLEGGGGLIQRVVSSPTPQPTPDQKPIIPFPNPSSTPIPTPKPAKPAYVDPDPIIDCESSAPNCKGSSIRVHKSQCSKITCCQVGNSWSVYPTGEKCTEAQKNTQPPQTTQKTQGNNVYCWNKSTDSGYYTSSGDQCNSDNAKSSSYMLCQNTQTAKFNSCMSACKSQSDQDVYACAFAYKGSSAAIENSPDKYGECLNGADSASNEYKVCTNKCLDQNVLDLKQCI
jgi:hypothetical protein